MYKCKVCGKEFELKRRDHYISRDNGTSGLAKLAGGSEEILYDAFDCPHCGCQSNMQVRKRVYEEDYVVEAKEAKEAEEVEEPQCFGQYDEEDFECYMCEGGKDCEQATTNKEEDEVQEGDGEDE